MRGTSVLLYRKGLPKPELLLVALFASVPSLGLVVVITQIGLQSKNMNQDIAQALIAAALLSSLVYPTLARAMLSRTTRPAPSADSA